MVPDDVAQANGLPKVSAEVDVGGLFVAGPFRYDLRRARIEASGLNESRVQWRYNLTSELTGSSEFQSWVVVKVSEHVKRLNVCVQLGVLPFRRHWLVFKAAPCGVATVVDYGDQAVKIERPDESAKGRALRMSELVVHAIGMKLASAFGWAPLPMRWFFRRCPRTFTEGQKIKKPRA